MDNTKGKMKYFCKDCLKEKEHTKREYLRYSNVIILECQNCLDYKLRNKDKKINFSRGLFLLDKNNFENIELNRNKKKKNNLSDF